MRIKNKLTAIARRFLRHLPLRLRVLLTYHLTPYRDLETKLGKYILIDYADHSNIGDCAISVSEMDFIKKNISDDLTLLPRSAFWHNLKYVKRHAVSGTIFLQGGAIWERCTPARMS